jgi:hypothetical protein
MSAPIAPWKDRKFSLLIAFGLVELFTNDINVLKTTPDGPLLEYYRSLVPLLEARSHHRRSSNTLWFITGAIGIVATLAAGGVEHIGTLEIIFVGVFLLIACRFLYRPQYLLTQEINQARTGLELEIAREKDSSYAADRMLRLQHAEIQRYTNQGLKTSAATFALGLLCILLGFAIVAASFVLVENKTKYGAYVPFIGAIGGILTNFVALLFLRMNADSNKVFSELHRQVGTAYIVHLGAYIAAQIKDQGVQDKTYSELAIEAAKVLRVKKRDGNENSSDVGKIHEKKPKKNTNDEND